MGAGVGDLPSPDGSGEARGVALTMTILGVGEGEGAAPKKGFARKAKNPAKPKQRTMAPIRIPCRIFVLYTKLLLLTFRYIFG